MKRTKLPAAVARQVAAAAKIAQLGTTKAKIAALGKNGRSLGEGKGGLSVKRIPRSWYSKEDARDGESGVVGGFGRGGVAVRSSDEKSRRAGLVGGGAEGGGGRGGLIGELGSDVVKDLSGLF